MFRKILNAFVGDPSSKIVKRYQPVVVEINELEPQFEAMSDDECAT